MPRSCIILRTDWGKNGAAKVPGPLLVGSGSGCRSWALRHRDIVEDVVGGESFGVGFVADHDPVPHHVAGEGLDVVRGHIVTTGQEGVATGGADRGDSGPGTGAQLEQGGQSRAVGGGVAGGTDEIDHVFLDRGGDPDRHGQLAKLEHVGWAE
jgi:hypothetical protein